MPHARWLLAGAAIVIVASALVVATVGRRSIGAGAPGSSSPNGSSTDATREPSQAAAMASVIAATAIAASTPAPSVAVAPTRTRTPAATPPPRATGAPRLALAEFLSHVNDDRATVSGLNAALETAATAQDPDAVRRGAVDILDFVDAERDWLREHPPAECYAAAHASARRMLDAYATAAERFIDWTAAGAGLDGLAALAAAGNAAETARVAFTSFGTVLEGTTCPG